MSALPKEEVTYIEEEQLVTEVEECILLNPNHRIWPVCFWAVFLIIVALMGMGVLTE